jgi:hypothetical protein
MKNRRGGNVMVYICWLGIECDEMKGDVNKQVESNSLDPANDDVRHLLFHFNYPTHRPITRLVQHLLPRPSTKFPFFPLRPFSHVMIMFERLTLPYCLVLLFVVKASSVLTKRSDAFVLGVV